MSNIITTYLSEVQGRNVSNAELMNSIRSKGDKAYQEAMPSLKKTDKINHSTVPLANFPALHNQFFANLVNRIGTTIIKSLEYKNPLAVFRRENMNYGDSLQEIYVGLADGEDMTAKQDGYPFKFYDTEIMTFYHTVNREKRYSRSFTQAWAVQAFTSDYSFDEFVNKMMTSLIASDEVDEYTEVRNLITKSLTDVNIANVGSAVQNVHAPYTIKDQTQSNYLIDLATDLIKHSNLMTIPSRTHFENGLGVPKATKLEDQVLIMSSSISAEFDLMLMNAFNMGKALPNIEKIVVDTFPTFSGSGDANGLTPVCAIVSRDSIILADQVYQLSCMPDDSTLRFNQFLHHYETISYSLIENSHVFCIK